MAPVRDDVWQEAKEALLGDTSGDAADQRRMSVLSDDARVNLAKQFLTELITMACANGDCSQLSLGVLEDTAAEGVAATVSSTPESFTVRGAGQLLTCNFTSSNVDHNSLGSRYSWCKNSLAPLAKRNPLKHTLTTAMSVQSYPVGELNSEAGPPLDLASTEHLQSHECHSLVSNVTLDWAQFVTSERLTDPQLYQVTNVRATSIQSQHHVWLHTPLALPNSIKMQCQQIEIINLHKDLNGLHTIDKIDSDLNAVGIKKAMQPAEISKAKTTIARKPYPGFWVAQQVPATKTISYHHLTLATKQPHNDIKSCLQKAAFKTQRPLQRPVRPSVVPSIALASPSSLPHMSACEPSAGCLQISHQVCMSYCCHWFTRCVQTYGV